MPESEVLMKKFGYALVNVLSTYPFPLEFHTPSNYHMTLDYHGDVTNINEYITHIRQKKDAIQPDFLCDGITRWRSTIDQSINFLAQAQYKIEHNTS
jgi:hypothetical protein